MVWVSFVIRVECGIPFFTQIVQVRAHTNMLIFIYIVALCSLLCVYAFMYVYVCAWPPHRESARAIGAYCAFLFLSVHPFIGCTKKKNLTLCDIYVYLSSWISFASSQIIGKLSVSPVHVRFAHPFLINYKYELINSACNHSNDSS